ncbi:MAG: GntR family transcriptional regulator, partial [Bacillota bacterium]|nr:GntR family transcriptional regulator [Bacillota bacterium]
LPSVRDLSAKLTVNPNTIQKAYHELENQGWIYSVTGLGNFVATAERTIDPKKVDEMFENISAQLQQLRFLGMSERDIRYRLMDLTKGGNGEND